MGGSALLLTLLIVAALGWRDADGARQELVAAREILTAAMDDPSALATPEGRVVSRAKVESALRRISSARDRISGSPIISVAGAMPWIGTQRDGLLRLVDDVNLAATTGKELLVKVDTLAPGAVLRDGVAPLPSMSSLSADVREASKRLGGLQRDDSGLFGPLGNARRRFDELALSGSERLGQAADALDAAQTFMGSGGPRTYLIALQNNTEMRDQGAVLAYVEARFDRGRFSFGQSGSVREIPLDRPAPTPIPPGTQAVFGSLAPTQTWQSVNATADFAWSGQAMADMYQQATGQVVDGVIGIDLPGLRALLEVVGPVEVSTLPEPVTPDNIFRILGHDIYVGLSYSTEPLRQERYSEMTEAVIDRLTTGGSDAVRLGAQLGNTAKGGHLRLWSRDVGEEQVFERSGLGGMPGGRDAHQTFHLAVENRTPTKLDYYVAPAVRQDIELTRNGAAIVHTTVTIHNNAPAGAQPSYQLGPDGVTTHNAGDYLAWALLWAPAGSRQTGGSVFESGLELSERVILVPPAESREVTFETIIPDAVKDGRFELRMVPQPRMVSVPLEIKLQAPGWDIEGDLAWQGFWDRTIRFSWRATR